MQRWVAGTNVGTDPPESDHSGMPSHRRHKLGKARIFDGAWAPRGSRGVQLGAAVQVEEDTQLRAKTKGLR